MTRTLRGVTASGSYLKLIAGDYRLKMWTLSAAFVGLFCLMPESGMLLSVSETVTIWPPLSYGPDIFPTINFERIDDFAFPSSLNQLPAWG